MSESVSVDILPVSPLVKNSGEWACVRVEMDKVKASLITQAVKQSHSLWTDWLLPCVFFDCGFQQEFHRDWEAGGPGLNGDPKKKNSLVNF